MEYKLERFEAARAHLFRAYEQAVDLIQKAPCFKQFPANADEATILFATALARQAERLCVDGFSAISVLPACYHEPVSEMHNIYLDVQYEAEAGKKQVSVAACAAAGLTTAEQFARLAFDLTSRATRCLNGDETVDGREIRHGDLWDK